MPLWFIFCYNFIRSWCTRGGQKQKDLVSGCWTCSCIWNVHSVILMYCQWRPTLWVSLCHGSRDWSQVMPRISIKVRYFNKKFFSLGMRHDGGDGGNSCSSGSFIMSPTLGSGKISWSPCSRAYLHRQEWAKGSVLMLLTVDLAFLIT